MLQVCEARAYFKSVDSTGPWPAPLRIELMLYDYITGVWSEGVLSVDSTESVLSVDSTGPPRIIELMLYHDYRCVERGRIKCGQYWPPEEDGEEQCDEFIVINTGMEQSQDYTITGLFLHNTKVATGS